MEAVMDFLTSEISAVYSVIPIVAFVVALVVLLDIYYLRRVRWKEREKIQQAAQQQSLAALSDASGGLIRRGQVCDLELHV